MLDGTAAFGRLIGPFGETKLCEACYRRLARDGAHLLGEGVELTLEQ